ncbi:MAG: OmpA family protein [Bryobacteraceae bacterium]|nr:OmpA family protein [Bryobacteraceae bacterium]
MTTAASRVTRILVVLLAIAGMVTGQFLVDNASKNDWEEINFDFDSAILTDGFPSLLRLAELLNQNAAFKVKLDGHTDSIGGEKYNENLSQRRCEAVRAFLLKYGARAAQIEIVPRGKRRPRVENSTKAGRWINRRVVMTALDAQGNAIGPAGSVGEAIKAIEAKCPDYTQSLNDILRKLDKLDDIAKMLGDLKNDNNRLKAEVDALKGAGAATQAAVQALPKGATPQEVQRTVETEFRKVQDENPRFSILGVNLGADQDRKVTFQGRGRYFAPFGDKYAFQGQGEYFYFRDRQEAQGDFGLVNRFHQRAQFGAFASFKHVRLDQFQQGGTLGQAAFTLDYIFKRGRVGFFGTKAFMNEAVMGRAAISRNVFLESYLRTVDQAGGSASVVLGRNTTLEGNLGYLNMHGGSDKPGGTIRLIQPINNRVAVSIEGGWNETLVAVNKTYGRITGGVLFGDYSGAKEMFASDRPVPVDVPRVRYELLTRRVRTGNDAPIADAGPDQLGVAAGTITLDGSASYDPDGDSVTYQWNQIAGPSVSLTGSNESKATFTGAEGQNYSFRLTVTDSLGLAALARTSVSVRETPKVAVTKFTATPSRIRPGETVTLTWQAQNADSVEISGVGSVNASSGSIQVTPTVTTTYTITAKNKAGEVKDTVQVIVDQPTARVVSFTAAPSTIKVGESSNLVWETENAQTVSISGFGQVNPTGTLSVSPKETTTYTITVTNQTGETNSTVTVTVTPAGSAPTIGTFTSTLVDIGDGEGTTLTWQVEGADSVEITDLGKVAPSGSAIVRPTETRTYTLTATNQYGTSTAGVTITVQPTARVLSFTASPSQTVNPGDPVRLTWATSGAVEVSISGIGAVTPNGQLDVTPQADTTYTLTARGARNTATQSITVRVSGQRPPNVVLNIAPYFTTQLLDHVFDASGSTDPDGGALTFKWEYIGGNAPRNVTFGSPNSAATTVKLTQNTGEYLVQLTVTSSSGVSVTKLIRIMLVTPAPYY